MLAIEIARLTGCEFGGARRGTLYVASASFSLSAETLAAAPSSGSLFARYRGVRIAFANLPRRR